MSQDYSFSSILEVDQEFTNSQEEELFKGQEWYEYNQVQTDVINIILIVRMTNEKFGDELWHAYKFIINNQDIFGIDRLKNLFIFAKNYDYHSKEHTRMEKELYWFYYQLKAQKEARIKKEAAEGIVHEEKKVI